VAAVAIIRESRDRIALKVIDGDRISEKHERLAQRAVNQFRISENVS
jgi:hypothetical protein